MACLHLFVILALISALIVIAINYHDNLIFNCIDTNLISNPMKDDPDNDLSTLNMIRRAGYPAESHVIETDDGYLLTLHRIPGEHGSKPIFLQHGLLGSSADWIIAGKYKSLAFLLADKGYDIWLGNVRGNTYSRAHTKLSPEDPKYWDFSWHEMGLHDLPAELQYITRLKRSKIIYIGHSMGTTMFYVMASQRQDIASKVELMFSLAPVAFMNHLESPIRFLAPFSYDIKWISNHLGKGEFLPHNWIIEYFTKYSCEIYRWEKKICTNFLFSICGFDQSQFNETLLPSILSHIPAGASTKSVTHYAQEIKTGKFQPYDYGSKKNKLIYNNTTPPDYELSKISVPIHLFYGDNDFLSSPIDVKRLYVQLTNTKSIYRVPYSNFNHLDFLWGMDAPKLVYEELFMILDKQQLKSYKAKLISIYQFMRNYM